MTFLTNSYKTIKTNYEETIIRKQNYCILMSESSSMAASNLKQNKYDDLKLRVQI